MSCRSLSSFLTRSIIVQKYVSILFPASRYRCARSLLFQKHPYARIMREHYLVMKDPAQRPHIIGLTASPIFNVKNPLKALNEIEQLSACRVFVVKDNKGELKNFTFQAKPIHWDYEPSPSSWPAYPGPLASSGLSLWDHFHSDGLLPSRLLGNTKWYEGACSRHRSTLEALGPFAADLFIYLHTDNVLTELSHQLPNPLFAENDPPEIARKRAKVAKFRHILQSHHIRLFPDSPVAPISREWISPKVLALRELLAKEDASTFRGMIFVSQRHFAACISVILPRLDLPGIAPAPLVGHGDGVTSNVTRLGSKGMGFNTQERVVQQFREGKLNLIIATSVGEEGLDFPQCSFVCRFDMPHTLPAYIQSRGRARHSNSKFVLMLEAGDNCDRVRAIALETSEPSMKQLYGKKMEKRDNKELQDEPDDGVPAAEEPNHTVESTGATLHASSAISLLNNLCSLIPRDAHTPIPLPRYSMNPNLFVYKVKLPASLPVPRDKLDFSGQVATSKKAAKRSAAYEAVLELHKLGVFDDHFLPVNRNRGSVTDDIDGKPPVNVDHLQPMMEAPVFDIWDDVWRDGATAYIHPLEVEGLTEIALVLGNNLYGGTGTIWESNRPISFSMGAGTAMEYSREEKTRAFDIMEQYTKFCLGHAVTRKGRSKGKSRVFLVPFDSAKRQPDYAEMERILSTPHTLDWSMAGVSDLDEVYVQLMGESKLVKVLGVQPDMSVAEALAEGKLAKRFASLQKFRPGFEVPDNDLILRCRRVLCTTSSEYRDPILQKQSLLGNEDLFYPKSLCERVNITTRTLDYFKFLPPLTRHLSDTLRARAAMMILGLPPLNLDRATEALMLPSANASFSNQRLETLGDAFLKLATSIHVFNKFPYKHEGQLSCLRQNSVCNKYLMGRGHALGLMRFMTIEPNNHRTWRLNAEETIVDEHGLSYVRRCIPRRSIQDCMEALLGVALLSGGIECGLSVGTKMGLCFGGADTWSMRYAKVEPSPRANICAALEDALGYRFKDQRLVMEAVNHPTSGTGGATYQRLEFLGDGEYLCSERIKLLAIDKSLPGSPY
jgi:endoribonuclease Dicer